MLTCKETELLDTSDLLFAHNCADDLPGCRDAFITKFEAPLKGIIGRILKQDRRAAYVTVDDLVQDCFLSLFENKGDRLWSFAGRNGCSLKTWVFTVAVRRTLNQLRRHKENFLPIDDVKPGIQDKSRERTEQRVVHREALTFVLGLIEKLPDKDRLIFRMIHEDGRTYDEAVAVCRIKKGAVYTRMSRIRAQLRKKAESAGYL